MRMSRLERASQWCACSEQMGLPDILIKGLRAQPISQWPIRAAGCHLPARPITSTPGGGTKVNKSAANLALRFELVKVSCVT
jgi:hypothetical protein